MNPETEQRLQHLEKQLDRLGEFTYRTSTRLAVVSFAVGGLGFLFAIYAFTR